MKNENISYLVFDIESVPDASLIKSVKYPGLDIPDSDAVSRFQEEILANSDGASLFIPVTFQLPISICIADVTSDFKLVKIELLDAPEFRTQNISAEFWNIVERMDKDAALVTFNGRGFDIPLMELMAYRFSLTAKKHFRDKFGTRYRFGTRHIDLHDWISNFSAIRVQGGLDMLSKIIGMPGKMKTKGDDVYDMYLKGKIREINDYCIHDVLDTYFVFLRTRVMIGEIDKYREKELVESAISFIEEKITEFPALREYIENITAQ